MQLSEANKVIDMFEEPGFADSFAIQAQREGVTLVEYIDSIVLGANPDASLEDQANLREAFLVLINGCATNFSQDTVIN
jgi:hypothetical protein